MSEAAVDAAMPRCRYRPIRSSSTPAVAQVRCFCGYPAHSGAHGLGVDLDADAIAEARRKTAEVPVRFEVRDASTVEGPFDAVINVASSHVHGGFPAALEVLPGTWPPSFSSARASGSVLPSAEYLAALGGASEDELADLDGLRGAIRRARFE